ncbi:uncharacterized protein A1O9_09852 [Exophiala aquamarina CBS 119918]|uniref:Acyltransferase MbtK/IucB-like conserved domain-containing protein n=1 Tax=Exophiala aquamarina CBS 119918 TaxID=1182545 RepID=A0A072P2X9_9EURO|nr:uncharacterized protein A1O9_09852 [Exophiala aquamarina CBS 119918]KEF54057.1 hypothetical protein A1O9_09852 [Exophiala aquamarina CBS 119918]
MSAELAPWDLHSVRLPEPWKTTYEIEIASGANKILTLKLVLAAQQLSGSQNLPEPLHNASLAFSDLINDPSPTILEADDNSAWARFHLNLLSYVSWSGAEAPSVGQIWALIYAIFTQYPENEAFRLRLTGTSSVGLATEILATGIATPRPRQSRPGHALDPPTDSQVLVSRSAFWQGAASPFGTRPVWVSHPSLYSHLSKPLAAYPAYPLEYTVTFSSEGRPVHAQHPVRPPKPPRSATIYSRYIPELDEFLSMDQLDWQNESHLQLFNHWQNDPRVSRSWNETGTLEQHREYLRKIDEDAHQMAILARFNGTYFAYFETYWAKLQEDHMGVYISPAPGDWDRGRHSLVGDVRYRGPDRASIWWTCLIHYLFLDDPRTTTVVGEPNYSNEKVLSYDMANGFHIHKLADLPHKRSAIMRCERIRFFQTATFALKGANAKASLLKARKTRRQARAKEKIQAKL